MAELPTEEREAFLAEYGVAEPAGAAVTRAILEQADIIPFFTVGEDECRAWAISRGTVARAAAGKVHSDLERGFIRAEVIGYEELAPLAGGLAEAKKLGKLRLEGKDYVVQDGDIVHVRFNV
jgi:ribosome-binding ATPase YchF (GTP1/OBG family)